MLSSFLSAVQRAAHRLQRRSGDVVRKVATGIALCGAVLPPAALPVPVDVGGKVNVLTQHNDNARTGYNASETILTQANVRQAGFGQLFAHTVDGYVYAQPLVVSNVRVTKHAEHNGLHDVLIVATQHNSIYAFDANDSNGPNADPLWHATLMPPNATTVPSGETGSGDIVPEIGITGTPVIDGTTNTIYVIAKTKEDGNYVQRLHALDVGTGEEKFGAPVDIQASVPGTGDGSSNGIVAFDSLREHNRPGLLLVNGIVYIGWASHGDNGPYHGWVIGYNARTLKQVAVHNSCPNGGLSGYWMAGSGLATDGKSIFTATGNGSFTANNGGKDYGDSYVRLNLTDLSVMDWMSPFNNNDLNAADADLGSGGVLVLPASAGSAAHPRLMVACGKEGKIYLIDRDKMGGFKSDSDSQIVQSIPNAVGGVWSMPAFFNGKIYYNGAGDVLKAFSISKGIINTNPQQSTVGIGFPGATPSISANGTRNGIVWLIQSDGYGNGGPAILRAFNADDISKELYNSSQAGQRDTLAGAVKFAVPTVANGKVYVGAQYQVAVFGRGKWVETPVIDPGSTSSVDPITVSITDATPGATIYYTLDGTDPTPTTGTLYSGPFLVTSCANVQARAYAPGYARSGAAQATILIGTPGTGDGLQGCYYQSLIFDATPVKRIDSTVNFSWNGASPIDGILGENFSVRWTGFVQPRCTGKYTFFTASDDGVRLWVNDQLLIDNWTYHGTETDSGTINLVAGQKYSIKMEYFQGGGGAVASLSWSALGLPAEIIPQSQLYSGSN